MLEREIETAKEEGYSVEELRRQYLDYESAKSAEIEEQREARHYYHGDQWTRGELNKLKKRNQPPVTANRIARKIDGIVGLLERMRQDPKAYARTPQEDQRGGADVATAVVRYTLDANQWQAISSGACCSAAINGIGGIEMSLEPGDEGDPEIKLDTVDCEHFFYDPRSTRIDFSDARFLGSAKWVDLDLAKEMFPDAADELDGLISNVGQAESLALQDREKRWVDSSKKRLFLVEHWYIKGGEWRYCYYVASKDLMSGDSPFYDEKGRTIPRYLMFSANVDHESDRYGMVRNLKSLQDEVNARRSKALHLLNTRRVFAEEGAVKDPQKARAEMARPDGWVELNPGGMDKMKPDDEVRYMDMKGQIDFLTEAKTEIENFSFNPSLVGTGVQDMSGRAISLQQQAGIAELGPFIVAYRNWKISIYRAVWNAAQRYWKAERWIRVTDNEGVAQFMQLNQLTIDKYGRPAMVNQLGALDVDIIIDEGPDTITMMQDTYDTMTALAQKGQAVPPDVLIELSPLPSDTKRRILERLQQSQQPNPLQVDNQKADTAGKKAKAMKDFAGAMRDFAEVGAMPDQVAGPPPDMMGATEQPQIVS